RAIAINSANEAASSNQIGNITMRDVSAFANGQATTAIYCGDILPGALIFEGPISSVGNNVALQGVGIPNARINVLGQGWSKEEYLIAYNISPNAGAGFGSSTDATRIFYDFRENLPTYILNPGWLQTVVKKVIWYTRWDPVTTAGGLRL